MHSILLSLSFTLLLVSSYARNIYVAKSGNDSNTGTIDQPYLTISKAAQIAIAGDNIYIREGVYEETLQPSNSGVNGNPITFQGYQDEKVVITAMETLSGWTSDGGNRYKTTTTWDLGQRNFVMKGTTTLDLARWPNNTDGDRFTLNSLRNDGGSQDQVSIDAFLTDTDIPNWNWSNGGSIMFYGDRPGSGWTTWRAWIKGNSQGRVDFDAIKNQNWIITAHPPGDLGDYYLEGIKEALDYENEWYFDPTTKTLYIILPNGAQPLDGEVQMAKREMVIDLTNRNYIHIKNLAVFGGSINIKGTGNTLYEVSSFYGSMTRGITPNFNSGVNAINVDWAAVNTTIEKCKIGFGDGTGVWDSGSSTIVKNCFIHDFDMLGSYDAPLMIRGQNNAKILNNTVTRGGRDALQIISKGSEVAYNDFSYSNLIADDCALLYTIGANLNMDIHHNWFHDAEGRGHLKKAAGIYLDNDAGNVRVYRNVVWNTEWTSVQINWNGTDIDIFNNTFSKNSATMGAWHKAGTVFSNVKVWNNITDEYATDNQGNQELEATWEAQADKQNNFVSKASFVDHTNNDFHLIPGAYVLDSGRVITGYTDGFTGTNPDPGAYEFGGDDWTPGTDWDRQSGASGICYGLPGETCNDTSITAPTAQTIDFVNAPSFIISPTTLTVEANYTVDSIRDIVAVLLKPDGSWLSEDRTTVTSGSGIATLTISFSSTPIAATNYKLLVIVRENGGDWADNMVTKQVLVDIVNEGICASNDIYNECFEQFNSTSWGGWGTAEKTTTSIPSEVYNGNYAYKVKGLGAGNFTITGLQPNTSYNLTGYVKIIGTQGINFGVKSFDDINTDLAEFSTNTTFEQKLIQFTTGPTTSTAQIYFYSPDVTGEGFLDDIAITKNVITSNDISYGKNISLYPNPTQNAIHLSTSSQWSLFSIQGTLLEHGESKLIDLSKYNKGIFWLKIGTYSYKVAKQ